MSHALPRLFPQRKSGKLFIDQPLPKSAFEKDYAVIIRQGIDLTSVKRIEQAAQRQGESFFRRIFTPAEIRYCQSKKMKYEHYAARFAAKEAAMKAFEVRGESRFRFREIEVRRKSTGKPCIYLSLKTRKLFKIPARAQIELSMTHERDFAAATVIMVLPEDKNRKRSKKK